MVLGLAQLAMMLAAPSAPNPQSAPPVFLNAPQVFDPADYPYWALQMEQEGPVGVAIQVDPMGKVTGCSVVRSSGSEALDGATCSLIFERARFAPARDSKGIAVAGIYHRSVHWVLEDREPAPVDSSYHRVIMSIGRQGKIDGCRVEAMPPAGDPRTCEEYTRIGREILRDVPAAIAVPGKELVAEVSQFAGEEEGALAIGRAPGDVMIDRLIMRVTVAPDGKVRSCNVVEQGRSAIGPAQAWCNSQFGKGLYVADPAQAQRRITFVDAAYVRPKAVTGKVGQNP